jgi:hypothetical protein
LTGWLSLAQVSLGAILAAGMAVGAHAAYIPTPQVGDVFSLEIDLDADGAADGAATLTLNSAGSGTADNSTISPFAITFGSQTFSFPSSPATWFFDELIDDGFSAMLTSSGCDPGGITPCSLTLNFNPEYTGDYVRMLGDSPNDGPLLFTRLQQQPPGQVGEPGILVLVATMLALLGGFHRRARGRAGSAAA